MIDLKELDLFKLEEFVNSEGLNIFKPNAFCDDFMGFILGMYSGHAEFSLDIHALQHRYLVVDIILVYLLSLDKEVLSNFLTTYLQTAKFTDSSTENTCNVLFSSILKFKDNFVDNKLKIEVVVDFNPKIPVCRVSVKDIDLPIRVNGVHKLFSYYELCRQVAFGASIYVGQYFQKTATIDELECLRGSRGNNDNG